MISFFLQVLFIINIALNTNSLCTAGGAERPKNEYVVLDGDSLLKITNGTNPNHEALGKALGIHATRLSPYVEGSTRQAEVWGFIDTFDSYKTSASYSVVNGKPTLQNIKYIIVPIWWSDLDTSDSSFRMDPNDVLDSFGPNQQYYIDMSWGKMTNGVEYFALEQQLFDISSASPGFDETENSARDIVDEAGFVKGIDYDGICLMYFSSKKGPFSGVGGWANVNDPFFWSTYPGWFDVTRHEVGHNFGHPHHLSVSYEYRNVRPSLGELKGVPYDGYDMMSLGNHFDVSHFAAGSKWFYNWIPDSSIILMQPEGRTDECPSCFKQGTFTLSPFDDKNIPPTTNRKMGIHIPIVVAGNRMYSYWLSYKTGVNGIAQNGLTVHLSWFNVGGYFGAEYDSLNFDVFGNTDTTEDSFVVVNTCFHLSPPGYLKDRALVASDLVQPVVCVDSVNAGTSITVTVSFLDKENPPVAKVEIDQMIELQCSSADSTTGTITLDGNFNNMIHVQNTGNGGEVRLEMCTSSGSAIAYFHDDYPYAAISYGSEAAYGSFKSLFTTQRCPQADSFTYKSDYGETYLLVPPTATGSSIDIKVNCEFNECLANQYLSNRLCKQCPSNLRSEPGSTSIDDCEKCPDGTYLAHPLSLTCSQIGTYEEITSAEQWRIWAPEFDTAAGWVVDIPEIEFYDNLSCNGIPIDTSRGTPFDSGNAGPGYQPGHAFDGWFSSIWGGRADSDSIFSVGLDFGRVQQVRCIKLYRFDDKYITNVRIQAKVDGEFKNAWIEKNLDRKVLSDDGKKYNLISMDYRSQSSSPTKSPVSAGTPSPTTSSAGGDCTDSPFRFRLRKNGKNISRGCSWVENKDTTNRCALNGVSSMCPSTCDASCSCVDGTSRFRFPWKGSMVSRSCEWVGNKQTLLRCAVSGMSDTCRKTCDSRCSKRKEKSIFE